MRSPTSCFACRRPRRTCSSACRRRSPTWSCASRRCLPILSRWFLLPVFLHASRKSDSDLDVLPACPRLSCATPGPYLLHVEAVPASAVPLPLLASLASANCYTVQARITSTPAVVGVRCSSGRGRHAAALASMLFRVGKPERRPRHPCRGPWGCCYAFARSSVAPVRPRLTARPPAPPRLAILPRPNPPQKTGTDLYNLPYMNICPRPTPPPRQNPAKFTP